jgi:two-component system, chemotaxis family, CheB/CheR fusion protein
MAKSDHKTPLSRHDNFIVAIGASAGGLEAIHEFFDNVPENTNLSFIIIQHLSPDYKSLLVELVSKHTQMQVLEAKHGEAVEPNCVYIIPNKKVMTFSKGKLKLEEKAMEKGPNTTIDIFLLSLAKDRKHRAIAVILSGTGSDGTRGIEAIKEAGGMVMVQDPVTARFDGMPNSAIATGNADFILPPELMPQEIYNYTREAPQHDLKNGKLDEGLMEDIFRMVFRYTGCDFSSYKDATIVRRISRRMAQLNMKELEDYVSYMIAHPQESKLLCKDFLIGVTKFFRDPTAFETLETVVFPAIIEGKKDEDNIKIWVSACSTGEEVYSIAIVLDRFLKKAGRNIGVKIFASDVDEQAVDYASRAVYPASIAKDMSQETLDEYFTKHGKKYQVRADIRKQIVFARQNIVKDPPFIRNDMISCRNMLIYMNAPLQKKILTTLHFSLNPTGFLFLGPSETVSVFNEDLEEIDRKWKIYRKKENARSVTGMSQFSTQLELTNTSLRRRTPVYSPMSDRAQPSGLHDDFCSVLCEDMGYAAMYIDKNYMLKDATGNFKKFLSLPEKNLNLNLLKMVSGDLSIALNTAIRKAIKENKKVILQKVKIRESNQVRTINIWVKPGSSSSTNSYIMIVLGDDKELNSAKPANGNGSDPITIRELPDGDYVTELQAELKESKDNLQAAIESLETANEELQSSNEELLSANEELQSSNEELQSLNEELHTLNTEHQSKIQELVEVNDDLNNYFRSTDIGQIMLDRQLRIRKFNPAAVRLVNLIDSDIGRPIGHISTNLKYDSLVDDIQHVILNRTTFEQEVELVNGRTHLMRIFPYIRQDAQADGAVVTFIDISTQKDLYDILRGVFNSSVSAILVLKSVRARNQVRDFRIIAVNDPMAQLFDKKVDELTGNSFKEQLPSLALDGVFNKFTQLVQQEEFMHIEHSFTFGDRVRWLEIVAAKMGDGLAATFTDITEKKLAEEKLQKHYKELVVTKDELKKLNEDLETKVNERTIELSRSEERFRLVSSVTNDAICDWNLLNDELWLSDNFFTLFGYPADKNVYQRDFWLEKVHTEDRNKVYEIINNALKGKQNQWDAEYRFRKYGGGYAHILDRGYILHDENGKPYRMLSSMLDVTKLRDAEQEVVSQLEQTKFLAETMPLMVWTAKPDGEVDFFNTHFEHYTGMSVREGKGKNWKSLLNEESLAQLRKVGKEAIQHKKDFSLEIMIRRHDGEYRCHLLRARAKKDAQGNLVMWVGTNTDIHEQKLANRLLEQRVHERTLELQKANKELANSNDELQQFASVASHDLKEPLRKIYMFSNMLKDNHFGGNDGAHQYIERIIHSSERMIQLVNDLLSFSRLSVESTFEAVDMNVILNEVLADLELTIQEKKATLEIDDLPVAEVLPGQIRQVFQNILSNALKFSKPNTPAFISISADKVMDRQIESPVDENGNWIRICIEDNGIGFNEKYLPKIFTIFQRLHTRKEYDGTGIGLAICKKIVEKHGGIITAKSQENVGSTFIIVLPLKQKQGLGAGKNTVEPFSSVNRDNGR